MVITNSTKSNSIRREKMIDNRGGKKSTGSLRTKKTVNKGKTSQFELLLVLVNQVNQGGYGNDRVTRNSPEGVFVLVCLSIARDEHMDSKKMRNRTGGHTRTHTRQEGQDRFHIAASVGRKSKRGGVAVARRGRGQGAWPECLCVCE